MTRKKIRLLILASLLPLIILYYSFGSAQNEEAIQNKDSSLKKSKLQGERTDSSIPIVATEISEKGVLVYLTGAVEEPGVYRISNGTTIGSLIRAAGGFLPYADEKAINAGKTIAIGEHIHIPFNFSGQPEELLRRKKISLNTSDATALSSLPGIGPAIAKRIIEHRQSEGPFKTIEDIKKVKGIGEALYTKIKEGITL